MASAGRASGSGPRPRGPVPTPRPGAPVRGSGPRISGRERVGGSRPALSPGAPRGLVLGLRPGWRAVPAACEPRSASRPGTLKPSVLGFQGKLPCFPSGWFSRGWSGSRQGFLGGGGRRSSGPPGAHGRQAAAASEEISPWRAPGTQPRPPAPVACAERWPLPAPGRDSKWRTRPGRAGGSPHKGKGLSPVAAASRGRIVNRPGLAPPPFLLVAAERGRPAGEGPGAAEVPRSVGGGRSGASLALVPILLGICPLSLDPGLFGSLWGRGLKVLGVFLLFF